MLPKVTEEGELKPEPTVILGRKIIKKHNSPVTMVLVQWSNTIPEDATWEEWQKICREFPNFNP